jgi:hypothetical protein
MYITYEIEHHICNERQWMPHNQILLVTRGAERSRGRNVMWLDSLQQTGK